MLVREWVIVNAPIERVWHILVQLTAWSQWNTALRIVKSDRARIAEGGHFRCRLRPFFFNIYCDAEVTEVIPNERLEWKGQKYGILSRHEILLEKSDKGVKVISSETFQGLPLLMETMLFPTQKIQKLTMRFLHNLKAAAENNNAEKSEQGIKKAATLTAAKP